MMDPAAVLAAAQLVKSGESISLAAARYPGMPLFPGHPPFQVLTYRSPNGMRVDSVNPWAPTPNEAGLGFMSELIISSAHSGAHVDALGHMTIGDDDHWHGGATTTTNLSDFGPTSGDATELPSFFARGVFVDAPAFRGVERLPAGEPITADELADVLEWEGVELRRGDVVLFRTGYMSLWPDAALMEQNRFAGPDLTVAERLVEVGAVATGSDTEAYEVQPTNHPGSPSNPQPVHTRLLIENGIYLFEGLDLEALSAARRYEFLFVALPLKIRGATGSMVDPVAVF